MYCEKCGAENEESAKYCEKCGNRLGPVYEFKGCRGRYIKVYNDRCIMGTKAGVMSFLTGNSTDGEKSIHYVDCIGVQFKKSGLTIGYLQLETASGLMNNKGNNFFNENSFTFDTNHVSNEEMEEVYKFIRKKVDEIKQNKNASVIVPISVADELKKFKELLDMGVLTQEEFDNKKQELLASKS